jgi:hypothetical protein
MTLCIAVKTMESYDTDYALGSVITCCDFRVETPTAAADIGYKTRMMVGNQWENHDGWRLTGCGGAGEYFRSGVAKNASNRSARDREVEVSH